MNLYLNFQLNKDKYERHSENNMIIVHLVFSWSLFVLASINLISPLKHTVKCLRKNNIEYQKIQELWASFDVGFSPEAGPNGSSLENFL